MCWNRPSIVFNNRGKNCFVFREVFCELVQQPTREIRERVNIISEQVLFFEQFLQYGHGLNCMIRQEHVKLILGCGRNDVSPAFNEGNNKLSTFMLTSCKQGSLTVGYGII